MIKKLVWVFLEKGASTIIQFVALIILGRLLTPKDYGTYGIMMVFVALSDTFIDSGFGGALVNKKVINQNDINTLFFTNITISLFLYILMFLSAPYLENFYQIDGLSMYFRVIGITIIIYALSIVQNALILRELKFKLSAIVNLISFSISTILAIVLAFLGNGIWSLILQLLMQTVISTSILWTINRVKINPSFSKSSFNYFWRFGSNLLGANILQTIANNISNSIIPKIGSLQESGLYFQANKLNNVPINIMTLSLDKGLFPIFSQEKTTESIVQKARYLNSIIITTLAPIFLLMSICSPSIIKIVLGDQWLDSSKYFSILLFGVFPMIWQSSCRNIVKSMGFTNDIFKIEVIKSIITLFIVLLSLNFGVFFLVIGVTLSTYLGAVVWSIYIKNKTNYTLSCQLEDLKKPIIASICVYLLMFFLFGSCDTMLSLFVLPIGYLIYLLLNFIIKNGIILHVYSLIFKQSKTF